MKNPRQIFSEIGSGVAEWFGSEVVAIVNEVYRLILLGVLKFPSVVSGEVEAPICERLTSQRMLVPSVCRSAIYSLGHRIKITVECSQSDQEIRSAT